MVKWFDNLFGRSKTRELEEQVAQLRLTNEIALNKVQKQLTESIVAYSPPYELINPFALFYDGQNLLFPLYPSRLDYRSSSTYIWLSEGQMDLLRAYARWLYETNPFCKGVFRGLRNFIVKAGFGYEIQPKRGKTVNPELLKSAQKVLEDFCVANRWHVRESEYFVRSRRDGEFFLRFFPQSDGITQVRTIEPETVRSPTEVPEWTFGIRTPVEDRETVEEYYVTYTGGPEGGEYVDPVEIYHCKINTDLGVKRGLSDLFSTQEQLDDVKKLLKSEVMGETIRSSIAYIRQYAQANQSTIQSLQANNTTFYIPEPAANGVSATLQPVQKIEPGSVQDIPVGLEYQPPPAFNTESGLKVLQFALQALAQYWSLPSWMLTGESSSASYASSINEESPFSRMCETEQSFYAHEYKAIMRKVLRIAVQQEILPPETMGLVDIQVVTPSVLTRQKKEQTERHIMLADKGIMSERTFAQLEDLDYEHEKSNIEHDQPDFEPTPVKPENSDQQNQTDLKRK